MFVRPNDPFSFGSHSSYFYSPQLSLNEGLVSLSSVASVDSDSACVALRFQVKFSS